MEQTDFDVIIAGAGAGGAAAAYYLTQAGLSVLVADKAPLPRYKACGGAIPRITLDRLPFDFDNLVEAVPDSVRFTFPDQPAVEVPLPDRPVTMVMRSRFDAFLLAQAGAEVWARTPVTAVSESRTAVQVEVGGRRLTARYLVGADGAASQVARKLGLRRNRQLGGSLEAEIPLNGHPELRSKYGTRAVFAFGVIPWGYAWSFPKRDHLSVGIGRVRPGKVDLASALTREMVRMGIPRNGAEFHGHPLPCYQAPPWPFWREAGPLRPRNAGRHPQEPLSTRRSLLIGDAAGLVDPLMGEGIRYAMASARLAAEAIIQDDLATYEYKVWNEIGHSLATAGLTAHTYYRIPRFGFQVGLSNPATIRQLIDVLTERSSYRGIGRRILATTARWWLGRPKASHR